MDYEEYINEGVNARKNIDITKINKIALGIINTFKNNGKLIVFGNGGSAADSQHFVAELTGHFIKERKSLPAIALTTNTSSLTAIGNDYSYDDIFSRQIQALCNKNDYTIGISTSGNSKNVINGMVEGKKIGSYVLGMSGGNGGKLKGICDDLFLADSDKTSIIQETHITAIHMICYIIDEYY